MSNWKPVRVLTLVLLLGAIAFLTVLSFSTATQANLAYDPNKENIVIFADMQWFPGPPPPDLPCPGHFFPRLRVWGDGLAFLDVSQAGQTEPGQWSGQLTPAQVHSALVSLNASGFFSSFTPEMPNPSGTSLRIGANLQSKSVKFESGSLEPTIYTKLIDLIKPYLQPLDQQSPKDSRIETVLDDIRSCYQ